MIAAASPHVVCFFIVPQGPESWMLRKRDYLLVETRLDNDEVAR